MKNWFKGLSVSTFLLTFSSLFSDISTEMLYPILPIFITDVLHAPATIIGIIEGIATATQYIIQGFSGWFSDRFQKRKPVALFGYILAAISKPLMGLATSWQLLLAGRFTDRLGAGTRSAPRDALVAGSATEETRGKAFGLEGIGDNLGAFIGPLIAVVLLFFIHVPIRWIFFLAFIPGILAVVMILLVREKNYSSNEVRSHSSRVARTIKFSGFPKIYWKYLLVTALFGIGNSSNAFLILRTKQIGIPLIATFVIYAFFNLIAALSSYPAGNLSDTFGRKRLLLFAFIVFILTYLGFAISHNFFLIGFLFILYGIYSGVFRSVGKAFATDFVPQELRASAIGWYSTTIGISGFLASTIGGILWTTVNPSATFIYGAVFAILGTIALIYLVA